jgi:hypothetical protein
MAALVSRSGVVSAFDFASGRGRRRRTRAGRAELVTTPGTNYRIVEVDLREQKPAEEFVIPPEPKLAVERM